MRRPASWMLALTLTGLLTATPAHALLLGLSLTGGMAAAAGGPLGGLLYGLLRPLVSTLDFVLNVADGSLRSGTVALLGTRPPQRKLFLQYRIAGTADHTDAATGAVLFRMRGPIHAAPAVDQDGAIALAPGPQIGWADPWLLRLHIDPAATTIRNTDTQISCAACVLRFNDGGILVPLLDSPRTALIQEIDVPMRVRLLPELGTVADAAATGAALRATGCMGVKEIAGRGYLANTRGALCVNGVFRFPARPHTREDYLSAGRLEGISNITLVMH